jgi:glucarate dehydratase
MPTIVDVRATTVTVPLQAALRHSNGAHWGRFVRTIVEVEADNGLVGLGEMGGGGESNELAFRGLVPYLRGHDVFDFETLRYKISNPTASLYNNRTQLHAAIEFACLDIVGQYLGEPVYRILGGKFRTAVPFASYLFFRYPNEATGHDEVRTIDQLIGHAQQLKDRCGFRTHKLKGGVFPPGYEIACLEALASAFPNDHLRYDPNAALSVPESIELGRAIAGLRNDYLEDPTWGLHGLRQVRTRVPVPLATNTVVVNFEQLATNIRDVAVDVVLLDTTFWGGIRACLKAASVCETFQLGIGVHSSGELGIQLATMLHLAAALPNLTFAADAHYHELVDDIIEGGPLAYRDGHIQVPDKPGLGIKLDRDKLNQYAELYRELGGYPYDRDPGRPGWFSTVPNERWADPSQRAFTTPPLTPAGTEK